MTDRLDFIPSSIPLRPGIVTAVNDAAAKKMFMGVSRTTIQLLLQEAAVRPFSGSVATLGRQHIYFTWDEFQQFGRKAGVSIPISVKPQLHREPKLARLDYASDATILAGLGFSECVTLDYSNYQSVDEIFDLNQPETPAHLRDRFDVVLDTGTLEHVFHAPMFWRTCTAC